MDHFVVSNLPVLDSIENRKISEFRDAVEKGLLTDSRTELEKNVIEHKEIVDDMIAQSTQQESQPRYSANIESLYGLVQSITVSMEYARNPPFIGKIKQDRQIRNKLDDYYKIRINQYATHLRIMITALINIDGWAKEKFPNYQKLEELVLTSDRLQSEEYLLELVSITRQAIPPHFRTMRTEVVDSNSVDVNKTTE